MTGPAVTTFAERSAGAEVQVRGVVHLYPSLEGDVVALRGVDLDVAAGEAIALLGPSGAGKSTVLSLLAGAFPPSAGQVLIGGTDLGRLDAAQLAALRAETVSLVVQGAARNVLPYATVAENAWFAQEGLRRRKGHVELDATDLLGQFGLADVADRVVAELPLAEQQLTSLVAGVASGPRLLLLDEPTSRLAPDARDHIVALILRIGADLGRTVVLVTHDPAVAAHFTRTVTIRDGRVGTEGRRGVEFTVVGRDGLVQLPADALEVLPPDSLVEVIVRRPNGVELRPARPQS